MLFSDPPMHNRLRKLVSYAFKPSHIEAQRPLIEKRCDELVLAMRKHDQVDLVEALASPLPVTVIAHMLGVADGDMKTFKEWSDAIFSNIADILFGEPSEAAQRSSEAMNAYFLERIAQLRHEPVKHLLGRLVETETDEGKLSDEELLSFCRLLLIAGNETTTGLITASVRVFDEFPETFTQIKAKPALPSPKANWLRPSSPPLTATSKCSITPMNSSSTAIPIRISPSALAFTSAWARTFKGPNGSGPLDLSSL